MSEPAVPPPLWDYIPYQQFHCPRLPADTLAVDTWSRIKKLFASPGTSTSPPEQNSALQPLPATRLHHLLPPLDWQPAAQALQQQAHPLLADQQVVFVVQPPHSGLAKILRHWADQQQAEWIEPPGDARILQQDKSWLDQWQPRAKADTLWVLPRLERCFLRHARGLSLVRLLLQQAARGKLGRGIIGCDSWGWAYLQRIWPMQVTHLLTLRPFAGDDLARLFSNAPHYNPRMPLHFRYEGSGDTLLQIPPQEETSNALDYLAARSRGNPGVAAHVWRQQLRLAPAEHTPTSTSHEETKNEETIWVASQFPEPALPVHSEADAALILHTLLLHHGLHESTLLELMPLPVPRLLSLLQQLHQCGLVEHSDQYWQITPASYPNARTILLARDYLTDDL